MTVKFTSNFFANARGVTFKDGGGITWTFNQTANELTATGAGGTGIGTVTSVGLTDSSTAPIFVTTGGTNPVVASGTLTLTLKTQTAAFVFAGPATGLAAQPAFRLIVATDIPTLNQNTTGNAATATTAAACSGNAATATTAAACSGNAATATTAATLSATLTTAKGGTGVVGSSLGAAAGVALADKGTWTPAVAGSTTAGTASYTTQLGEYTRIGDIVFFWCRVHWTTATGTGNFRISGLPFTPRGTIATFYPLQVYINGTLSVIQMGIAVPGSTLLEMDQFTAGSAGAQNQTLPAAGDLAISGWFPI